MAVDMRHLTSAGELTEGAVAACGSDLTGTLAAAKRQCGRRSPACARPTRCGPWPAGTARSPSAADQREPRRSRCDQASDHAPWNRLAASQRPSRGVASTTTPNQRPRISQLPARTSTGAHRGTAAADPRDARCQRGQQGVGVLPRAAARQSVSRPGSGRSRRQHAQMWRSMTTTTARPLFAGRHPISNAAPRTRRAAQPGFRPGRRHGPLHFPAWIGRRRSR